MIQITILLFIKKTKLLKYMVRQMILNTFFDDPIANERFKAKIVH